MEYDASALGTRRPVVLGVLFVTLQNELTKKKYALLYLYVNCDEITKRLNKEFCMVL
jgi:hypothetical protein